MAKMTKKGRGFVSDEISHLMRDGPSKGPQKDKKMPQKQAVAVALDVAHRKGFKTAPNPNEQLRAVQTLIQEVSGLKRAVTSYKLAKRGGAPTQPAIAHGILGFAGGTDPGKTPGPLGHMTPSLRQRRREMGWNPKSPTPPKPAPKPPMPTPTMVPKPQSAFDNFGDDFSTEVSPHPPASTFKSLDYDDSKPHFSTEVLPRPRKPEDHKPQPSSTYEDYKTMSMFDNIIESKRSKSQFDDIVENNAPTSRFDDIVEASRAPEGSMFDAFVESDNGSTAADWDDRVARTLHLSEELVGLRNQASK